jgi:hypothetical protein
MVKRNTPRRRGRQKRNLAAIGDGCRRGRGEGEE